MKRQSRERRNRAVNVRLTERDALLIEAVNRFRLVRTRDLVAVTFSGVNPMTASLRLRRLFDAGYLDVACGDRSQENTYSLGPLGRRWVESQGVPVGRVPRGRVAHHLAIVRAWSGVAEILQRHAGVILEQTRADWELREEFGEAGLPIVPDLFLVLRVAGRDGHRQSVALAVEVDLGTETLRVLERKLAVYAELTDRPSGLFGHRDFGLGVVLANPGRGDAARQMIERRWNGWWLLWTEEDGPRVAVSELVNSIAADNQPAVTDSCNGYRGSAGVTPASSTTSSPFSRGH